MPSVFIKTYGCQMNERDSEAVAAQLVAKGYTLAPSERVADVVLLNTCSVRDAAEQKAIGKMQNLAADVRKNRPEVILGFMGCMAQSRGQSLIDKLPDVDLVLGTQKFHRAAEYLDELLAGRRDKIVDVAEEDVGPGAAHLGGEVLHLVQRLLLGVVAHAASVQQHHVRDLLGRREGIAPGDELRGDGLAVALVHLATVGLDVNTRHDAENERGTYASAARMKRGKMAM